MLTSVAAAPPDPILGLSEAFAADERESKINLTIGVYRDAQGRTPILESVRAAEQLLLVEEQTKGYLGIGGLAEFTASVKNLLLGDLIEAGQLNADQIQVLQTPGGTGALKVAADFLKKNFAAARVWLSTPTWPNHKAIFETAGLNTEGYAYLADDRRSLDFEAMMSSLEQLSDGDVVCLHACCHNPTGVDPSAEQWAQISAKLKEKKATPLIDFAYHGFGDGLDEDRAGLLEVLKQHDEVLVCTSYSKNFALYSERVGALFAICPDSETASKVGSNIKQSIRCNYSNPPRHGGAIVASILNHQELRQQWEAEVASMRSRILEMRQLFVSEMKENGCTRDFSFLLDQRGMFSFSGLNQMQVDWLRTERGIYIVGSGRINVAGISPANVSYLCQSIAESLS